MCLIIGELEWGWSTGFRAKAEEGDDSWGVEARLGVLDREGVCYFFGTQMIIFQCGLILEIDETSGVGVRVGKLMRLVKEVCM